MESSRLEPAQQRLVIVRTAAKVKIFFMQITFLSHAQSQSVVRIGDARSGIQVVALGDMGEFAHVTDGWFNRKET